MSEKAQREYDIAVAVARALAGKDDLAFEISANDQLGHNALKNVSGLYGPFDAGWIDSIEFDDAMRDRFLAMSYQEAVATYAMAKSAFREAHFARRTSTRIAWVLSILLTINVAILAKLWWG